MGSRAMKVLYEGRTLSRSVGSESEGEEECRKAGPLDEQSPDIFEAVVKELLETGSQHGETKESWVGATSLYKSSWRVGGGKYVL